MAEIDTGSFNSVWKETDQYSTGHITPVERDTHTYTHTHTHTPHFPNHFPSI